MTQDQFYRNTIQLLRQLRIPFVDPCDSNYTGDCICGSTGPVLNGLFSTENNDLPVEVSSFRVPNQLNIIGGTPNSQLVFEEFVDWGVFAENFELEGSNNVTINSGNTMDLVSPTSLLLNSPILRLNDTNMPTGQPVDESLPPGTYLRVVDQDGELAGTGGWLSTGDIGGNGIYGGSGVVPDGTVAQLDGEFKFQTSVDNRFLLSPYDDFLYSEFLATSALYNSRINVYASVEEGVSASFINENNQGARLSLTRNGINLNYSNTDLSIVDNGLSLIIAGVNVLPGQVLKADENSRVVWGDPRPYKVYTALLTQTGTDAPVATVLENTLGGTVTFSRDEQGLYFIEFNQTFDVNKIFYVFNNLNGSQISFVIENDSTRPIIYTYLGGVPNDSLLLNTPIEIRVYP